MNRLFVSYTYNPHPDHVATTELLVKRIRIVVESLGFQGVDGLDLGGRLIDVEIRKRIDAADGLIALFTPWADANGHAVSPPYVNDEYQYAQAKDKPTVRIFHKDLNPAGMYANHEYILFDPQNEAETIMKVLRTLSWWRRTLGSHRSYVILPSELGGKFNAQDPKHSCEYQLFVDHEDTPWNKAKLWEEPGATFAYLKNVPDEAKIRMKIVLDQEVWESPYINPFSRIDLERKQ